MDCIDNAPKCFLLLSANSPIHFILFLASGSILQVRARKEASADKTPYFAPAGTSSVSSAFISVSPPLIVKVLSPLT